MTKRTANEIYEQLIGSCSDDLTDEESDDLLLMQQVDELMFRCACCGWWCEIEESSPATADEMTCLDCAPDEGE